MDRRLVAILAADVVGYSHLMEIDEADTLARLKTTRERLIDPKIRAHRGRVVKLMGDGALVEFSSVVDAVVCAFEIQRTMADYNAELPADKRFEFRIGVNLGDVMVEGDDIYGDGVNVAARLEKLADPGGVLISGAAFDQVEGKLDNEFEFLGEQKVKNIEKSIRIYRMRMGGRGLMPVARPKRQRQRVGRWVAVAVAALVLIALGVAIRSGLFSGWTHPTEVASKTNMALPLPDKPSIAVLPFTDMSSDASQQHFADGMTDDLITDLSKVSDLFVIARNSTFVYQGRPVKIPQVAEDLGVRYVLEGSVRREGDEVRVNAQLIDALTSGHVWADRFEGKVTDIFAVQDTIESKIVEALKVNLTKGEKEEIARAKTENINAKEAFDRGWGLYLRFNAKDNVAAIAPLKKAIELDPGYGRAYAALSLVYFRLRDYLWYDESGVGVTEAWFEAQRYMQLAGKFPTSLSYTCDALWDSALGRSEDARRDASRAIAADPNDPEAHIAMAVAMTISGQPDEALNFVASAIRLNPNYPSHYVLVRGIALFGAGDLEQAATTLEEGIKRNPEAVALALPLSSVLARLGRREEARRSLIMWQGGADQRALENVADGYAFPFRWDDEHKGVRERLYDGLRLAALPLDTTVSSLTMALATGTVLDRQSAARRLGWFGSNAESAVPALIKALNDDYLRKDAVDALRKIGPKAHAAIPALTALQDEPLIGSYAKNALNEIKGD